MRRKKYEKKRQHYVPASYTKAWLDPTAPKTPTRTPYVWVFDKDGSNKRNKAPEKIFRETDMYTVELSDGSESLHLENGLAEIESKFTSIRTSMTASMVKGGSIPFRAARIVARAILKFAPERAAASDTAAPATRSIAPPGWAYDGWPHSRGFTMSDPDFAVLRQHMVAEIAAQTIFLTGRLGKAALDRRVLEAMGKVPRHDFVRLELQSLAYADTPLPSGYGKTISQPFIVALMTDLLALRPTDIVLEVGTGLGYQTAILAELAQHVYSVELIEELAIDARQRLARYGCSNVDVRVRDGRAGWPDHAPFDKIIVTAAPDLIPATLIYQLKPGGRMVIPAGLPDKQQLMLVEKDNRDTVSTREVLTVRFSLLEETGEG